MREWLKNKRIEAGFTQEQVAKKAGIARTTYAMIEQGERDPSVAVAAKVANVLKFKWTLFFESKVHVTRIEKQTAV
ncbi:helix-turn-helix transcriptional regulator [Planococcus koreensis]|uniref:helix-turn-helix transcriptional regulator n=1 Tax=Planococcus koreensis TaxID=112331 RepID=UPI0039FB9A8E